MTVEYYKTADQTRVFKTIIPASIIVLQIYWPRFPGQLHLQKTLHCDDKASIKESPNNSQLL